MNAFDYPDYSHQESWGGKTPAPRRSPATYILMACGLMILLCILLCVCWVGLSFFAVRQPSVLTSVWVSYTNLGYYEFAEVLTCDDSPARRYTRELSDQKATFPNFRNQNVITEDDLVRVETDIQIAGELENWSATFEIIEGGQMGRCIQSIELE